MRLVEAQEEFKNRALPLPGPADKGHVLVFGDFKGVVLQDRLVWQVAEGDMVKSEVVYYFLFLLVMVIDRIAH